MVAKINIGSSLYGALAYNAQKVEAGEAKVLLTNKVFGNPDGSFDMASYLRDFEGYLPYHCRTEKPIIHISLNPHPDDKLTDNQLSDIASEYMQRLGYGNQPYMVYKHEDIDRHHIHIVSLRIDETGRKIDDKFEHRRSKDITRSLEQKYGLLPAERQQQRGELSLKKVNWTRGNTKRQIANVVRHTANRYHYLSFNEYRALLSTFNISAEEVKGEVKGKPYNGIVYSATDDKGNKVGNPFKSSLFGRSVGYEALQSHYAKSMGKIQTDKLAQQTKRTALDALNHSTDKGGFADELRKRGLDVVLRENSQGRIYGATYIDHNNGCVLNGSRLGKELSANTITEWFNNPQPVRHPATLQVQAEQPEIVAPRYEDEGSTLGGIFDLPIETHGIDPEEERFRHRMQKKKRQRRF